MTSSHPTRQGFWRRPFGWTVLMVALLLIAGIFAVRSAAQEAPDELVIMFTADGDGHLAGLQLAIGGARPLGGIGRLAEAVADERGYFPDALLISAGGDLGQFPDSGPLEIADALDSLGYDAIVPGVPELAVCSEWPTSAPPVISANVNHGLVADTHITLNRPHTTWGVTSVTELGAGDACGSLVVEDPERALLELFERFSQIDNWVVVSYLGTESIGLAQALVDRGAPVAAVISSGARREASALPWEPPGGKPMLVMDSGREWRDLLVIRLIADHHGLVSYEGTRRVPLDF